MATVTQNGLYKNSLFGSISGGSVGNLTMGTGYINEYNSGSIARYIDNTTISNCTNKGTIVSSSGEFAGGLVGIMEDGSKISSSKNNASVSVTSRNGKAGGIAGSMDDDSKILNSYNYANVSSSYGYAGGIVGYADDDSSYSGCYNYGSVSGSTKGDIIGNK